MQRIMPSSEATNAMETAVKENCGNRKMTVSIVDCEIEVGSFDDYDEYGYFLGETSSWEPGAAIVVIDWTNGKNEILRSEVRDSRKGVIFEQSGMNRTYVWEEKDETAHAIKNRFIDIIGRQYFFEC